MSSGDYILSNHAKERAALRGVTEAMIDQVMRNPEKFIGRPDGSFTVQGVVTLHNGRTMLLRLGVAVDGTDTIVKTAYLTTVGRYGS